MTAVQVSAIVGIVAIVMIVWGSWMTIGISVVIWLFPPSPNEKPKLREIAIGVTRIMLWPIVLAGAGLYRLAKSLRQLSRTFGEPSL